MKVETGLSWQVVLDVNEGEKTTPRINLGLNKEKYRNWPQITRMKEDRKQMKKDNTEGNTERKNLDADFADDAEEYRKE